MITPPRPHPGARAGVAALLSMLLLLALPAFGLGACGQEDPGSAAPDSDSTVEPSGEPDAGPGVQPEPDGEDDGTSPEPIGDPDVVALGDGQTGEPDGAGEDALPSSADGSDAETCGAPPGGCLCLGFSDCVPGTWSCDEAGKARSCLADAQTGCGILTAPHGCDDADACTEDSCVEGSGCLRTPLACNDGDPCNGVEACAPATGCVEGEATDCDDGESCNGLETCQVGVGCVAGTPEAGCCSKNSHCDDEDPCNGSGLCDLATGTCALSPAPTCDDGVACNGIEHCEPEVGCVAGEAPVCDDLNQCNGLETCSEDGSCAAGTPPPCDDGVPCNGFEACAPTVGCVPGKPLEGCCASDADCDDGDACNGTATCEQGACVLVAAVDCDDGEPCNGEEGCDPADGTCLAGEALDCSDDSACDGEETCIAGQGCAAGQPLVCDDDDACNGLETCHPASGCVAGTALLCSDGDACNGTESCKPDKGCVLGKKPKCDDSELCNGEETCDPELGCVAGTPLPCDDGDACNGVESCDPVLGCQDGKAPKCGDGDACNGVESCDPALGCVAGQSLECDDSDVCNGLETCHSVIGCLPGEPLDCDDDDACNGQEPCLPATGCAAGIAPPCDDGDVCNGSEGCDAKAGCTPGQDLLCTDGDACNGLETCHALDGCLAGVPVECDDALECTVDSCNKFSGECSYKVPSGCAIEEECLVDGQQVPSNPCAICDEVSDPFGPTSVADGFVCDAYPFGQAVCQGGQCLYGCEEGRDNCNADLADGCETELDFDPAHCGTCGFFCPEPLFCSLGNCEETCGGGTIECEGLCIDASSSATDCGECGNICFTEDAAQIGTCADSTCGQAACGEGTFDPDGDPTNGCEYACVVLGEELCNSEDDDCDTLIDEDFDFEGDVEHCGSCDPCSHETVESWICSEGACRAVQCVPGTHDQNFDGADGCEATPGASGELFVDIVSGSDASGDGSAQTPFASIQAAVNAAAPGSFIRVASGTYAGDVLIPANRPNLVIQGEGPFDTAVLSLSGQAGIVVRADGVSIRDIGFTLGGYGIQVLGTPNDAVLGGTLQNVYVESSSGDTSGGEAMGILAQDVAGLVIAFAMVEGVEGHAGSASPTCAPTANGGRGVGVGLVSCEACEVLFSDVALLFGGDVGQVVGCSPIVVGTGGDAIGYLVDESDGAILEGNGAQDLLGGHGGSPVTQDPGVPGGRALGVLVTDSLSVAVLGGLFEGLEGGVGGSGEPGGVGGVGGEASGVLIDGAAAADIEGVVVIGATGGRGGQGGAGFEGGEGGPGIGVHAVDGDSTDLRECEVMASRGGQGGDAGAGAPGGPGGVGYGILVEGGATAELVFSAVHDLDISEGGPDSGFGPGPGGPAVGVAVLDASVVDWSHTMAWSIDGPPAGSAEAPGSACIWTRASSSTQIRHVTCVDVGTSTSDLNHGIAALSGSNNFVSVLNSLFSQVDGTCVWSHPSNVSALLAASYVHTFECSTGNAANAQLLAGTADLDPQFVELGSHDLHLLPASPSIDAGVPNSPYCEEPAPDGCRVNLGFYGDTSEATSAPFAEHCGCP